MKKNIVKILIVSLIAVITLAACKNDIEEIEKEHVFSDWEITKAPSCTKGGKKSRKCQNCGFEEEDYIISTGHTYDDGQIIVNSTCKIKGVRKYKCIVCDYEKSEEILEKGFHTFDSGVITKEASCTEKGCKIFTCLVCSETTSEEIPQINHVYNEGEISVSATCTEDGETTYTCTQCSASIVETVPAFGHAYNEGEVTLIATCTEDGIKTYTCTECSDVINENIAATGHTYNDGEITSPVTCTENGIKTYTCTECSSTTTEIIYSTGHNYDGIICLNCSSMKYISNFSWSETSEEYYGGYPMITIAVGESYKLKYEPIEITNLFINLDNFVFYEPTYVVSEPSIISITPDGTITGVAPGIIGIKATGYVAGDSSRVYIKVISEYQETEYNNEVSYANVIKPGQKMKFRLSSTTDIDAFKFTAPSSYIKVTTHYLGDLSGNATGSRLLYTQILNSDGLLLNSGTSTFIASGSDAERTTYINTNTGYIIFKFDTQFSTGLYPDGYFVIEIE